MQDVEGWFELSKLRVEKCVGVWGSLHHLRVWGKLVAQGASKLAGLTEDVPMPGVGVLSALNNHAEVDAKRRCLEGKSALPSMVGNQVP